MHLFSGPWPWYVAGPLIGLFVPLLLVLGGYIAAILPGFVSPSVSDATRAAIASLGVHEIRGLAPAEIFSWSALLSWRGCVAMVGGGFLVGFGSAYAGGCTSGHGIAGLASLELSSLVAVASFFVAGSLATILLLPLVL